MSGGTPVNDGAPALLRRASPSHVYGPARWMPAVCWVIAALAVAGCTAVSTGTQKASKLYVGIVRVAAPPSAGLTSVSEVRALGLGLDDGPWLGLRKTSWITADPRDCQMLIIIRSDVEAASAVAIIKSLEGLNPCIVDYSRSSAR